MGLIKDEKNGRYLYILADGKLHERVDEGTEGAKLRTHVDDKSGAVTEKWELSYAGISGIVGEVSLYEGDYGTSLIIPVTDDEGTEFTLTLKASSKYGEHFMDVLPEIDLEKEVTFKPYSFPDSNNPDRRVQGITITQEGEKLKSHFNSKNEAGKWETTIKGYPMPDSKKKYNSEKWKIFFAERREFVMEYLQNAGLIKGAPEVKNDDF